MKYRKKPVEVEATQFDGTSHPSVKVIFGGHVVEGRQGMVAVKPGDWIITEADGYGFYPCNPEVFTATYEPVEDDHTDMRA